MIMYKKLPDTVYGETKAILRLPDMTSIPFDPDNTDFVEYQKWLAAGNTPIPADEPNV
jgi:hypothetical protein